MPIEEKPQLLEFNCTIEGMEDIVWSIKYDPNDKIGLHISGNGQNFHCPVDLFGDVTNFLRNKNIMKPDVLTKTTPTPGVTSIPGIAQGGFAASLIPPKIDVHNNISSVPAGTPTDALSSFDIGAKTSSAPEEKSPKIVVDNNDSNNIITPESKSEVINRTVIRTRVNKEDPMSAEKEAAILRGTGGAGTKKTIRKKHQVAE